MPMPEKITLSPLNTQIIELQGLMDAVADTYQDTATITCTLYDNTSGVADTVLNALSFDYVAGSDGIYRCTVPGTFNPALNTDYTLKIDVTAGANKAHFEIPVEIEQRVQ